MNNFSGVRNRRSLLDFRGYTPLHFPISNYSTSAQTKTEMKHTFEDSILINNLHLIPDPLKKNLADSIITGESNKLKMGNTNEFITRGTEKPNKSNEFVTSVPEKPDQKDYYPSLAGITSFFSGVFSVMGAMFQKRATSPVPQYYDCFENDYDEHQTTSNPWHSSKFEVQNKNEWAQVSNNCNTNLDLQMNADCKIAASHCEDNINEVSLHLENNQKNDPISKFKSKHPNMAYLEADLVKNSYEEAIPTEDILLVNKTFAQHDCPYSYQDEELYETGSPKLKTEIFNESFDIQNLPSKPLLVENKLKTESSENINITKDILKEENIEEPIKTPDIVLSCEDKLNRLKALLKTCHNKNKDISLNNVDVSKPVDIPHTDTKVIHDHQTETMFFNEIDSSELKNANCFNEVTGKFYSSSIESEDSFQIVFTDDPQNVDYIRHLPSDCESEDSFIMFEETPSGSCYTYNDVFGDDAGQDSSDSEWDADDSECISKLSPNLSRTFGDLTDNSLYSEDVVDYSVNMCDQINKNRQKCTGLLLNEQRKLEKKNQPTKTVHFSTQPPQVRVMRVWAFAARQARAGHWERYALDRERFKRRIADVEMALSWVLKPQHRSRIVFQRFMPWWNAERRKELAETKTKEDDRRFSVNSAEVNVVSGVSGTNDKYDDTKKRRQTEVDGNICETPNLFGNNNIVDENNSNIHKHIHSKTDDNDKFNVSVKNNIN